MTLPGAPTIFRQQVGAAGSGCRPYPGLSTHVRGDGVPRRGTCGRLRDHRCCRPKAPSQCGELRGGSIGGDGAEPADRRRSHRRVVQPRTPSWPARIVSTTRWASRRRQSARQPDAVGASCRTNSPAPPTMRDHLSPSGRLPHPVSPRGRANPSRSLIALMLFIDVRLPVPPTRREPHVVLRPWSSTIANRESRCVSLCPANHHLDDLAAAPCRRHRRIRLIHRASVTTRLFAALAALRRCLTRTRHPNSCCSGPFHKGAYEQVNSAFVGRGSFSRTSSPSRLMIA